jgi:hypothetical protein
MGVYGLSLTLGFDGSGSEDGSGSLFGSEAGSGSLLGSEDGSGSLLGSEVGSGSLFGSVGRMKIEKLIGEYF